MKQLRPEQAAERRRREDLAHAGDAPISKAAKRYKHVRRAVGAEQLAPARAKRPRVPRSRSEGSAPRPSSQARPRRTQSRAAEDQRPAPAPDDVRQLDADQQHRHHDDDEERLLVASEELQRHERARRDRRVLRRLREQEKPQLARWRSRRVLRSVLRIGHRLRELTNAACA